MLRVAVAFYILIAVIIIHLMNFTGSLSAAEVSTELVTAAELGDTGQIEALLNQGISVNAVNKDGWTALMKAVYEGNADLQSRLFDRNTFREKKRRSNLDKSNKHIPF